MKRLAVSTAIASIIALSSQNAMAHRISHDDFMKKKSDFKTMLKEAGKDWVDKKKEEARERKEAALELKEQRKEEAKKKKDEWKVAWKEKKEDMKDDMGMDNDMGLDDDMDMGNDGNTKKYDDDIMATPIPASFLLFGSGLIGLAGIARKRR